MACARQSLVYLVLIWGWLPVAVAQPLEDPDTAAAKRHFLRGTAYYDEQRFAEALREFEEARRIRPLPALDYNVGRANERLERWREAADEYERYLAKEPNGESSGEVRQRILVLRARSTPFAVEVRRGAPPLKRPLRNAAIGVAVGALVLAAAGTGVYFSAWSDYTARRDQCMGQCLAPTLTGLRNQVDNAVVGGAVLWSLAIVAAAVDVALFVIDHHHHRQAPLHSSSAALTLVF